MATGQKAESEERELHEGNAEEKNRRIFQLDSITIFKDIFAYQKSTFQKRVMPLFFKATKETFFVDQLFEINVILLS